MRLAKMMGFVGVLALANNAWALDQGWYGGFGLGVSNPSLDYDRTQRALADQGFASTISDADNGLPWRLFAGYRLNPYLALEGGYFDLGKFDYSAATVPSGELEGRVKVRGLNMDVVGFVPLMGKLSALGRVGAQYARVNSSFAGRGGVVMDNMQSRSHSWNPKVGLGLQYDFTPMIAGRAEWEHYRIRDTAHDRSAVNTWLASVVVALGKPSAAVVPVAVANEPVSRVDNTDSDTGPLLKSGSFTEESLFDFDSAALRSDGRIQLDTFAGEVGKMPYKRIVVSGHASRTGTDEYNMVLSERRAQAVSDYLVTSGGLDASRMVVRGKGSSEPLTQPGECPGADEKNNEQLQQCLQRDRRVQVEVSGAR